jgi:SAM-dependent methyltransferase
MPAHTHCRICGDPLPAPFLDLGLMPLANSFLSEPADAGAEAKYPLAVAGCSGCGLLQINYVVPAEQLYRNYLYVSATSDAVRAHATTLAEGLVRQYGWGASDLVVEVASNDGTVLKAFQRAGVRVLGVEPAENIAAIAEREGVPTVAEFFTASTARAVRESHGRASAILGRHVFAHVDDVHGFLEGVGHLLSDTGVFVIEVPYVGDLLEHLEFDTVYHEHLSYIGLAPMSRLAERHGLRLVDVERIGLHGGSIILHMQRATAGTKPSARLTAMLAEEIAQKPADPRRLAAFATSVQQWKRRFEALIGELTASGARLVGYGAAAKANTLLNYCPEVARSLALILDRSPHKHGLYTPGTHLRVQSAEAWQPGETTHMVILAWNFQQEIMRQMTPFKAGGGHFIVPIPDPHVV